jgi:hypothetical protein
MVAEEVEDKVGADTYREGTACKEGNRAAKGKEAEERIVVVKTSAVVYP